MTRRIRLLVLLARPAVVMLLGMYAALGLARSGAGLPTVPLLTVLLVVAGFLLFSVACNDLADEAIDRVNLPGDRRRPLVTGGARRGEMVLVAAGAAVLALAVSLALPWPCVLVTAAGLTVSAGYSLRPVRLADRGAVASMVLPACYVAVPYLLGTLARAGAVHPGDLALLAGLYLGFIGRILLKDFRDVRGDALFGKRTFLVRHGRVATCRFSAVCWVAGTGVVLASVRPPSPALVGGQLVALVLALVLLVLLARTTAHHREEALISAIAIVGRTMLVLLLAHLAMTAAAWQAARYTLVMVALALAMLGQAVVMARFGPPLRRVPMPETTPVPVAARHG